MYEFLAWMTVYAVWKIRGDSDPKPTNVPPMSSGSFAVVSFVFNVVGWGLFLWLIWSIM